MSSNRLRYASPEPSKARLVPQSHVERVEVMNRDHDHRVRGDSVISPVVRSQHDRGRNLPPRCRTARVSSLGASTCAPVPDKSFPIHQIPIRHTTPTYGEKIQGGGRRSPRRKPSGFRTRQAFLRHTCRAGLPPSESSRAGRRSPPSVSHRRASDYMADRLGRALPSRAPATVSGTVPPSEGTAPRSLTQ